MRALRGAYDFLAQMPNVTAYVEPSTTFKKVRCYSTGNFEVRGSNGSPSEKPRRDFAGLQSSSCELPDSCESKRLAYAKEHSPSGLFRSYAADGLVIAKRCLARARGTQAAKTGARGRCDGRSSRSRERCPVSSHHRGRLCGWRSGRVCRYHETGGPRQVPASFGDFWEGNHPGDSWFRGSFPRL